MLDISLIRAHSQVIKTVCQKRGLNIDVQKIVDLDSKRKRLFFLIDDGKKKFKNLNESRKYYDEEDFIKERDSLIKNIKENQLKLKETTIELKKNMLLLPNIIDMIVPLGNNISDSTILKITGKNFENIENQNKEKKYRKAIEYFKEKSFMDFGKIKFISDKNEFLMHPIASKVYISSWNKIFSFFSDNNFLPFSAPQYLNQKFSNIFDLGISEKEKESALVLTSFFANRFLNFGKNLDAKKFFSFRQDKREGFFDDFIFSGLILTSINQIEAGREFDNFYKNFSEFLKKFNIPHKIMILPIGKMKKGDSKRVSVRAFFPAENKYKTVVEIADTRDYYTRRLAIKYKTEKNIEKIIENEEENNEGEILKKVIKEKKIEKFFPYLIYTSEINSFDIFELIVQNNQDGAGNFSLPKNI